LADAAFPAGAFGHSFGLETAIVEGRVRDAESLHAWIERYLVFGCATSDGAAMWLLLTDRVSLSALDERLGAAQPNAEIRRANAHLARATLDTYLAMGLAGQPIAGQRIVGSDSAGAEEEGTDIAHYRAAIGAGDAGGIHALAAALGYRAIGAQTEAALEAHATTLVAGCASVAARAVPLGQRDVARVRWNLRGAIGEFVARASAARELDDLRASAVECEIDGLRHRRLPARLFAS
jgi:urease accessory protein